MSRISDMTQSDPAQIVVYEGRFAESPASTNDLAEVTIPAFDREQTWGPAPWMPRGATLPSEGDRCAVALAETEAAGQPAVWIVAWWPS